MPKSFAFCQLQQIQPSPCRHFCSSLPSFQSMLLQSHCNYSQYTPNTRIYAYNTRILILAYIKNIRQLKTYKFWALAYNTRIYAYIRIRVIYAYTPWNNPRLYGTLGWRHHRAVTYRWRSHIPVSYKRPTKCAASKQHNMQQLCFARWHRKLAQSSCNHKLTS